MFYWWEHVIAEVQQVHMLSNYFITLKKYFINVFTKIMAIMVINNCCFLLLLIIMLTI